MPIVRVTGGVDTHADVHVAAAVDHNGGVLGIQSFAADRAGYEDLLGWLTGFGPIDLVGVEGTGSSGVGLARFLTAVGLEVLEVDRPNRQQRRKVGKSDPTDALAAGRAALSGAARVIPKSRNGPVEQMRVLLAARRSARHQRETRQRRCRECQTPTVRMIGGCQEALRDGLRRRADIG
jgi:transposase